MIVIDKRSLKAKLFRLCLRNPFARGRMIDTDGKSTVKPIDWYLENGTTLCHFFITCFWLPLATIAVVGGLLGVWTFALVDMHVQAYQAYGVPGLFLPVGVLIGAILSGALVVLSIIGAGKVGLWGYLTAIKDRVCPRMGFE